MSITYAKLAQYAREIREDGNIRGKNQAFARLAILLFIREEGFTRYDVVEYLQYLDTPCRGCNLEEAKREKFYFNLQKVSGNGT